MRNLLVAVLILAALPVAAFGATQAETCNQLEDVALAIIRAKKAGVTEPAVRQEIDVPEDNPLYHIITRIYSSDAVTQEYVLADAGLQCSMMFIFQEDDGSRGSTGDGVELSLPPTAWLEACTKLEWIKGNRKIRAEGTLIGVWESNPGQANEISAYLWSKKDEINTGDFDYEDALADPAANMTEFKRDTLLKAISCVTARLRNDANP